MNCNKLHTLCNKALVYWGEEAQLNQATEELAELIVAINHTRRHRVTDIIGEIADVYIILKQLEIIFDDDELVSKSIDKKLEKLEERLN